MFDVAPSELLLCAIVALVVIGPKDLPRAMRFIGKWVGKARSVSRHFRSGLDAMMREAELDDLEKQWRDHNAAIMKAYPDLSMGPHVPPPAAGGAVDAPPPAPATALPADPVKGNEA